MPRRNGGPTTACALALVPPIGYPGVGLVPSSPTATRPEHRRDEVCVVSADARSVRDVARAEFAAALADRVPDGAVVLATCHRIELYATDETLDELAVEPPAGSQILRGAAAVRHVVRVAVGLESAIVGEDQVLHQLRLAVRGARATGPLDDRVGHLVDTALSAGRRGRSWLPRGSANLADVALDRVVGDGPLTGPVLIVGAGEMGSLAARAVVARGGRAIVASRTPHHAEQVALQLRASVAPLDPPTELLGGLTGVVVALAGPWSLAEASRRSLAESGAWVVDLSSPSALHPLLREALGPRLTVIDDLVRDSKQLAGPVVARLETLVDQTVDAFVAWDSERDGRAAARVLAERATERRATELEELWARVPELDEDSRREVERMAVRLTDRLLREALERLRDDVDGRRQRAVRELFGL